VIYGVVWKRRAREAGPGEDEEAALMDENPLMVLMEVMRLQNLRLVDLFQSLDKNLSKNISLEEMHNGLVVSTGS
jgi:hypothetical protein